MSKNKRTISTFCAADSDIEISFDISNDREVCIRIFDTQGEVEIKAVIDGLTTWNSVKSFVDRALFDAQKEGGDNG